MSAIKGFRGLVGKLQKALVVTLALVILFGAIPVGRAQAATGGVISSVHCERGYYNYTVAVNGATPYQWVAIRYWQYNFQNGVWTSIISDWTVVQAQGPYTNIINANIYANSGAWVTVYTQVLYWNGIGYEETYGFLAGHYDLLDSGPFSNCEIW